MTSTVYDIIKVLNQNDDYGMIMIIWDGLGKWSIPHGIGDQCYWKTFVISNTILGFTWIKGREWRGVQYLMGLHEGLVLLKDLPNPLRPNRTYMNNKRGQD